jgi:hypothetical protein
MIDQHSARKDLLERIHHSDLHEIERHARETTNTRAASPRGQVA